MGNWGEVGRGGRGEGGIIINKLPVWWKLYSYIGIEAGLAGPVLHFFGDLMKFITVIFLNCACAYYGPWAGPLQKSFLHPRVMDSKQK